MTRFGQAAASGMTLVAMLCGANVARAAEIDVTPRPVSTITPGTRIAGTEAPPGWSRLLIVSYPRIREEDAGKLPDFVQELGQFVLGSMVAKVVTDAADGQPRHRLEKVAFGLGTMIDGHHVIVSSDTQQQLGADFGVMKRTVFSANEEFVRERVRQTARTPTMTVIDMTSYVLHQGEHRLMVVRYCVLLVDDRLGTLVWLLDPQPDGSCRLAQSEMQLLRTQTREDRVISIDESRIALGMIPKEDAFAVARIPQGAPVPFPESVRRLAALRTFSVESITGLERELRKLWDR